MVWTAPQVTRPDRALAGEERFALQAFLDWHRATLLYKCQDLTGEQLAERALPPSDISLLGLIRHMTWVERLWFRQGFAGEDIEEVYERGTDFTQTDSRQAEADYNRFTEEVKQADAAVANAALGATFDLGGQDVTLRSLYLHMIEEYARHIGHADLLRERIDGVTGE